MIIYRVTHDMFEFESVIDLATNPVNLIGVSGAGLAAVFRDKAPKHIEAYKEACRTKELRVGTVQVFTDTDQPWAMLLFPTKRHYQDLSEPDDIKRGLMALRELLKQDQYRYTSIAMPMLGCGLGKQDYEVVRPMMEEYLSDLEATVFLCMSPDRTEFRPKYLTVVGPLDYGNTEEEQKTIDWAIEKSLEVKMGMKLEDYTGIVSGGFPGVDAYVCGSQFGKAKSEVGKSVGYEDSYVYRKTGKLPLVVQPNKARNGIGASLHQGNLLGEIGDDVILIKPKGHNNNRLSAIQVWLETQSKIGLREHRVAIFGERDTENAKEDPLIVQKSDIPY